MRRVTTFLSVLLAALLLSQALVARGLNTDPKRVNRTFELRGIADEEDHRANVGPFGAVQVGTLNQSFGLLPMYGTSDWNDITQTNQTGSITQSNGEIVLSTGTNSSGTASIRTVERLQYVPGATLRAGVRIRAPAKSDLSSGQTVRWGAFDDQNGFFFEADSSAIRVGFRKASQDTTIAQKNWNRDTLDGSGDANNTSGDKLNLNDGIIYQIRYNWYGDGDVFYDALVPDTHSVGREMITVHRESFTGDVSIEDPNQPIKIVADNGGATSNMDVFVGGRQASRLGGRFEPEQRPVVEFISDTTITAPENTWKPLIACRKKNIFPSGSGRSNSVRVEFRTYSTNVETADAAFRMTRSDTVDATFSSPTDWGSNSAMECVTNDAAGTINSLDTGNPFDYTFATAGTSKGSGTSRESREIVVLGSDQAFVLWGRAEATGDPVISASMKWEEQW